LKNFKSSLPNVLTSINMSLGIIAILFAVNAKENLNLLYSASLLVIIAALTDRFDGKVARMLDVTSELGKELDSLADLISFGLAPIIITWKITFMTLGIPGYVISLIYPIAGAYRLARFNVTTFDKYFMGIPITIAGAFLSIDNLYNCFIVLKNGKLATHHIVITAVLVLSLSYFMISKIKIKKM